MEITRRRALQMGGLATVGALTLAACSSQTGTSNGTTTLWYWGGGLSDRVVKEAAAHFKSDKLQASVIGGDFKQKLQTTLAAGRYVPTITGVKGEDMPYFRSVADRFVDLGQLGAKTDAAEGLSWKWKQATTSDGKIIGVPIDVGPSALFFRTDLFEQAGLPTNPTEVSKKVATWDEFYELGKELHGKVPSTYPVSSLSAIWGVTTGQTSERFISESGKFTGDSDEMKNAWDIAVRAELLGLNSNSAQSFNQDLATGRIGIEPGPVWHALDIEQGAPSTSGKWGVANQPVKPTNLGGSFLTIPSTTKDPKSAYEIIQWILSPSNEAKAFSDASIFPANPKAWTSPALTSGDTFFGGQELIKIFGPAAKLVPTQYEAAADAAVATPYSDQLTLVETAKKNPDAAWKDAVSAAKQIFERQGQQ